MIAAVNLHELRCNVFKFLNLRRVCMLFFFCCYVEFVSCSVDTANVLVLCRRVCAAQEDASLRGAVCVSLRRSWVRIEKREVYRVRAWLSVNWDCLR